MWSWNFRDLPNDFGEYGFRADALGIRFQVEDQAMAQPGHGHRRQCLREHGGIDYLQVFTDPAKPEALWFIEDGPGGAITALLPSDY